MGQVYRAFMLNDDTVHLFMAADNFLFHTPDAMSDFNCFWDFMMWHNPIHSNLGQVGKVLLDNLVLTSA